MYSNCTGNIIYYNTLSYTVNYKGHLRSIAVTFVLKTLTERNAFTKASDYERVR